MDSDCFFRYGVGSADSPDISSQLASAPVPDTLFDSLKLNLNDSPSSPFSTRLHCDNVATVNGSQEQQSSSDNFSGSTHSSGSPYESRNYYLQLSPSVDCNCNTLPQHSGCGQRIEHVLHELEAELMETDGQTAKVAAPSSSGERRQPQMPDPGSTEAQPFSINHPDPLPVSGASGLGVQVHSDQQQNAREEMSFQGVPLVNLKQLLIECAGALSEYRWDDFDKLVGRARASVSISGEPIQRLGAYMIEGLVARKQSSGTSIYRALGCKEPLEKDLLSYTHLLYEACPNMKFGYMAANGAIAEACRTEDQIHIIDYQIAQGTQWLTLLQALAARRGGPPHVRITGIDDPVSRYARGADLEAVGQHFSEISEKFHIPIDFHPIPVFVPDVTKDMLDVRPGEALAVNFPLVLHHTPDESVDVNNPRDGLLRMVKSLSPKVVTLVEQESNTNTTPFFMRFVETLEFYSAMFESIDITMQRNSKERINVEQHCLAKDIVNVIACEGMQRLERHELLGKWKSRFTMAGFQQYPLSPYVNSVIKSLLGYYSEHYTLLDRDGAILLGWKERMLISASAWH